jgi:Fe-S-cluster containining protein
VLGVVAIEKKRYERCPHVRSGNKCCGIYDNKPEECSEYTCAWQHGVGSKSQRPDSLGVVFSLETTVFGLTLLGLEVRPGCGEKPEARQIGLSVARPRDITLIMGGVEWRKILFVPRGKEALVAKYIAMLNPNG